MKRVWRKKKEKPWSEKKLNEWLKGGKDCKKVGNPGKSRWSQLEKREWGKSRCQYFTLPESFIARTRKVKWTFAVKDEVKGNSDGSSQKCWRANRFSDMAKGAKDSSNYLVAGSARSFSQESRGRKKLVVRVKIMISGMWETESFSANSQTLNNTGVRGCMKGPPYATTKFPWWAVFGKQDWRCRMNWKSS